jgi:hypothetical protein
LLLSFKKEVLFLFFSEEKNQKTFVRLVEAVAGLGCYISGA